MSASMGRNSKVLRAMRRKLRFHERIELAKQQPTPAKDHDLFVHSVKKNRTKRGIGHFPSKVMNNAMVPYHSKLERSVLRVLDVTIGVKSLWPQSETYLLRDGTNVRSYTPDVGVKIDAGHFMIEAKYAEDAKDPENEELRKLAAPAMAAEGWTLLLLTDEIVHHPVLLKNLDELRRRKDFPIDEIALRKIHRELELSSIETFEEVSQLAETLGAGRDLIWASIYRRRFYCDLWCPIGGSTRLTRPEDAPAPFILDLAAVAA